LEQVNFQIMFKSFVTTWHKPIILLAFGLLFFVPFNGDVHLFDWDEINFAESSREMIVTGNYLDVQIDYKIFWEKPPLFFWMQVASMKMFGVNEFAARFPNVVCGIVVLLFLFYSGKRLINEKFGFVWALTYACSLLPFFYFKSGIIDPWFNTFIFISLWYIILYSGKFKGNKSLFPVLSGFFLGLAMLIKGPVAVLIFALTYLIVLIIRKSEMYFRWKHLLFFVLAFGLTGGSWFIMQMLNGNMSVIEDFIVYQIRLFATEDAGHGGFLLYHFVILFVGVFPASVLALRSFFYRYDSADPVLYVRRWMIVVFCVVLVLFTVVETKIVHYSSMCYFPLSFLAALQIYRQLSSKDRLRVFEKVLLVFVATVFAIGLAVFSQIDRIKSLIIDRNIVSDAFAIGNLQADGNWLGFEWAVSLILLVGVICFVCVVNSNKRKLAVIVLAVAMTLFNMGAMVMFVPRAEEYSQKAAVEFFKSLPENDCYVATLGYKSYADLYYFNKPEPRSDLARDKNLLLWARLDKPAYFISKNTKKDEIVVEYPQLTVIGEKNGFVFYKREVQ